MKIQRVINCIFLMALLSSNAMADGNESSKPQWRRHTIDDSSEGADGIRFADVNNDGKLDIVTGWEEGGQVRVCLHPGISAVKQEWPSICVGKVKSPEDAFFVDIDGDQHLDVVSCCEGSTKKIFVHWNATAPDSIRKEQHWNMEPLPAAKKRMKWMYGLSMNLDGKHGPDLIAGGKGKNAAVGWFRAPSQARQLNKWTWHPIYAAGWIMSLYTRDIDGDGDEDIILTDRRGENRGCAWLENPGQGPLQEKRWPRHVIEKDYEAMFATLADLNGDGLEDIIACGKFPECVRCYYRTANDKPTWTTEVINLPESSGTAKAVEVGDIDDDGQNDLVVTCENADGKHGVFWLSHQSAGNERTWAFNSISGSTTGIKFDIVRLLDLDSDGDLDAITCEERDNLGVIWYENPGHPNVQKP